jgi:RecA-family ATPase
MVTRSNKKAAKAVPLEIVKGSEGSSDLLMPTLGELLKLNIPERQHLLNPWLREHESCLLYAATGVGKSLFALSAALAVAGNGSFLRWKPDPKPDGSDWRVLYVDGEQHIGDIQDRARMLMDAVPEISRAKAQSNLQFLARQQQDPAVDFPEITDAEQGGGQERILQKVLDGNFNLLILDNFSTLGVVADENDAASFNSIQSFLLRLKTENVATILVHHTGKSGESYRGSTKLAATFEIAGGGMKMQFILMAFAAAGFIGGSTLALADSPVSPAEAEKIKAALEAMGCTGGKMEKESEGNASSPSRSMMRSARTESTTSSSTRILR